MSETQTQTENNDLATTPENTSVSEQNNSSATELDISGDTMAIFQALTENSDATGETTDTEDAEGEAESVTNPESVADDGDDEDDLPISFTSDDESKPDPIQSIYSKVEDPELKSELEAFVSSVENERQGFTKLHEQVTTVREIAGVQSLNEVTKHYEEFVIPWSGVLTDLTSDDADSRDTAIKKMVSVIVEQTGLDTADIYNLVEGFEAPTVKPAAVPSEDMALKVLGITKEEFSELGALKAEKEFVSKYGKAIRSHSEKLGFDIDPVKIFQVKRQNPGISDEAALIQAYPKEYKGYIQNKGLKRVGKASEIQNAPGAVGKGATVPSPVLDHQSKQDDLLSIVKALS
jgi:hypothetical protein